MLTSLSNTNVLSTRSASHRFSDRKIGKYDSNIRISTHGLVARQQKRSMRSLVLQVQKVPNDERGNNDTSDVDRELDYALRSLDDTKDDGIALRDVNSGGNSSVKPWRWEETIDAQTTYLVFILVLALGNVPQVQEWKAADIPYFISLALITMYAGAHRSLNSRQRQQINLREGFLAPVFASVAIVTVYFIIKLLPDLSLQSFFDAYFWVLACIASYSAFYHPARRLGKGLQLPNWEMPVPNWLPVEDINGEKIRNTTVFTTDIIVLCIGIAISTADLLSHHTNFTLNNTIACLVAADILQFVGLSSFRVAGVLLVGLLMYDVYWVFGSAKAFNENVMLAVATSDVLVGPTRLLFPRIPGTVGEASTFPFSLLGLGDIAVPGLLACLALRFDASRSVDLRSRAIAAAEAMKEAVDALSEDATGDEIADAAGDAAHEAYERIANLELEQRNRTQGTSTSDSEETVYLVSDSAMTQRTYFKSIMVAYVIGLSMAFVANDITHLGQPALLYLVPATLGTVALVGKSRKEISRLWNFKDTVASRKVR